MNGFDRYGVRGQGSELRGQSSEVQEFGLEVNIGVYTPIND